MAAEQEVIAEENLEAETEVKTRERRFDQQREKCERILYLSSPWKTHGWFNQESTTCCSRSSEELYPR